MKKKPANTTSIVNSRARYDYDLKDEYIAGIVLSGAEAKSLRFGRGSLRGAFITIKDGEAWLNNMQIMPTNTNHAHLGEDTQTRARKLLLKQKELNELIQAKDQGSSIVPLKVLTKSNYIKVILSTASGKRKVDKRQIIKTRETNIDIRRSLK